jgi:hypothetical protein
MSAHLQVFSHVLSNMRTLLTAYCTKSSIKLQSMSEISRAIVTNRPQ